MICGLSLVSQYLIEGMGVGLEAQDGAVVGIAYVLAPVSNLASAWMDSLHLIHAFVMQSCILLLPTPLRCYTS